MMGNTFLIVPHPAKFLPSLKVAYRLTKGRTLLTGYCLAFV